LEKQALNFQALRGIARNRLSDYIMGAPNAKQRLDLFRKRLNQRNRAITNSAYTQREKALRNAHINARAAESIGAPAHVKDYANKQIQRAYDRMNSAYNDVGFADLVGNRFRAFPNDVNAVLHRGSDRGLDFVAAFDDLPFSRPTFY